MAWLRKARGLSYRWRMKLHGVSILIAIYTAACGSSGSSSGAGGAGASGSVASSGTLACSGGALPAGKCRSNTDCQNGDYCGVLNLPPFCGGQCDDNFTSDCQSDADCADAGVGLVCDLPCRCNHGGAQPEIHCTKG